MSTVSSYIQLTLPTNGVLDLYDPLSPQDTVSQYIITGSPTLIGNVTITSTNPDINVKNRRFDILWKANPDYDIYGIQIFGSNFTEAHSATGGTIVVYNDGSSNTINFYGNLQNGSGIKTADIEPLAVDESRLSNLSVSTAKLQNNSITPAKLDASTQLDSSSIAVSFETGEQGGFKYRFQYPVIIQALFAQVTKELADTDSATITPSNSVGDMSGIITIPALASFGTVFPLDTSGLTNNTIAATTDLTLTTSKPTAGGKANITIVYKRV